MAETAAMRDESAGVIRTGLTGWDGCYQSWGHSLAAWLGLDSLGALVDLTERGGLADAIEQRRIVKRAEARVAAESQLAGVGPVTVGQARAGLAARACPDLVAD